MNGDSTSVPFRLVRGRGGRRHVANGMEELFRRTDILGLQLNEVVSAIKELMARFDMLVREANKELSRFGAEAEITTRKSNRLVSAVGQMEQKFEQKVREDGLARSAVRADLRTIFKMLVSKGIIESRQEYDRIYDESFDSQYAVKRDGNVEGNVVAEYFNFEGEIPSWQEEGLESSKDTQDAAIRHDE